MIKGERMNTRELAVKLIERIMENGEYCHTALNHILTSYKDLPKNERALLTRLCLGTIEHCITIDYEIEKYSKLCVKKMKPFIRSVLRVGTYQIGYLTQIPDSAICNESVKLVKKHGFTGLEGFVNGVLRNISRNKQQFAAISDSIEASKKLSIQYSMPEWITIQWMKRFGKEKTEQIYQTFQKEKPITIRINESKITKEELLVQLQKEGVQVVQKCLLEEALSISGFDMLERLESFRAGYYQVQDESSMCVGRIADIKAGDFILDICAAPGGKSLHAAELLCQAERKLEEKEKKPIKKGRVIARDISEKKVKLIEENKKRIGYRNLITQVSDALILRPEDIEMADIVIADLPCSGLGIIGRKPDIRYKVTRQQQKELAELQRKILQIAVQYVKKNGVLIYSTCTICPEENEQNFEYLLSLGFCGESLEEYLPVSLHTNTTKKGFLQVLPSKEGTDGFFLSRARKK